MMVEPQWRFTEQKNRLKTIKITIMKKLFTLFAIILSIGVANAQTKEETISWLKEKLSKYMYAWQVSNIRLESIDECKIVFNFTSSYSSWQQILPTSITGINDKGKFLYSASVASTQNQGKEAFFQEYSFLNLEEREENLRARVEKALKHLATFCPKKQEAF